MLYSSSSVVGNTILLVGALIKQNPLYFNSKGRSLQLKGKKLWIQQCTQNHTISEKNIGLYSVLKCPHLRFLTYLNFNYFLPRPWPQLFTVIFKTGKPKGFRNIPRILLTLVREETSVH